MVAHEADLLLQFAGIPDVVGIRKCHVIPPSRSDSDISRLGGTICDGICDNPNARVGRGKAGEDPSGLAIRAIVDQNPFIIAEALLQDRIGSAPIYLPSLCTGVMILTRGLALDGIIVRKVAIPAAGVCDACEYKALNAAEAILRSDARSRVCKIL